MGGEYSFLQGATDAFNPYFKGAVEEKWRRKREDKATADAIQKTKEGRDWQVGLTRAGSGMGGSFESPQLQALADFKKSEYEKQQAQKTIDETRKTVDHKNKQLGLLSTATKDLQKTIKDPNIPNDLKLANINAMYGQYRELGYNMPDWKTPDLLNYQEKIKSDNNTIISTNNRKGG